MVSCLEAGEVDQLYAVGKSIDDSTASLNRYLNKQIRSVLRKRSPSDRKDSCTDVSLYIMQELGSTDYLIFRMGALNTAFELWAEKSTKVDRAPGVDTTQEKYEANSIYAPGLKFFDIWPTTLDRTINVGGVYFGTDKLSHFLGSGYEYYRRYLDDLEKTGSKDSALMGVIRWGVDMESSITGIWVVGVFSYADLEANYQGFLLAKSFCDDERLQNISGRWYLKKEIDVRDFINPNWDETFNANSYTPQRRRRIAANIDRQGLCRKTDWNWLQRHYGTYQQMSANVLWSRWIDTGLSSALLPLLRRQDNAASRKQYRLIAKRYGLTWSYSKLKKFFGTDLLEMTAIPYEDFCQVRR